MESKQRLCSLMLFKVDARRCNLRVGDHVVPGMIVGTSAVSGELMRADCAGVVDMINSPSENHAMYVWVRLT